MDNTQFFSRLVTFTRKDQQVGLADINHPDKVSPLGDWLGIVISLADGHHTIQEMINFMARQYNQQQAPETLEKTLHSVIERLLEENVILLSNRITALPYYLSMPIEELDIEKAKTLMIEDNYH
ncbi:MAG: hypothetical protein ACI9T9_001947 [Oleiphilaceae bacterium]|jgi:hypothetical protein